MPRPDPLDNIMTQLRAHGGTDPNTQAARKADLEQQRRQVGATPQATRQPPQPAGMPRDVMPQTPGAPEGLSPEFQDQPNMMGVIIDALNEAIIGLKTEIHRSPEPETKRKMEKQAQKIRDTVLEMGGDPVWGDESIDEGLGKLRGLGAVNMLRPRDRAMEMRGAGGVPDFAQQAQAIAPTGMPDFSAQQPQQQQPQQPQFPQQPPNWVEGQRTAQAPPAFAGTGGGMPDWVQGMRQPIGGVVGRESPFGGWREMRRLIYDRMRQQVGQGGGES